MDYCLQRNCLYRSYHSVVVVEVFVELVELVVVAVAVAVVVVVVEWLSAQSIVTCPTER